MSFDFIAPVQFFELLYEDQEFCEGVGKVMLAAGMLESNLRMYLLKKCNLTVRQKSTLGELVGILKEKKLLSSNGEIHFDDLALKRNHLAHNLFDLFSAQIEETILPRNELVESDVYIFVERAHTLGKDFLFFARAVASTEMSREQLM